MLPASSLRSRETFLSLSSTAQAAVAALPIAEGHSTSSPNFDVQALKVKVIELKAVGSELVTVPAGTFDAFKAEILCPDDNGKTMLWIPNQDRRVVKATAVIPRINGATLSSEIQK